MSNGVYVCSRCGCIGDDTNECVCVELLRRRDPYAYPSEQWGAHAEVIKQRQAKREASSK